MSMQAPVLDGPASSALDFKWKMKRPARRATTHALSSGRAGTVAASRFGLPWSTVRNMLMGCLLTLPISSALSAKLFWAFSHF